MVQFCVTPSQIIILTDCHLNIFESLVFSLTVSLALKGSNGGKNKQIGSKCQNLFKNDCHASAMCGSLAGGRMLLRSTGLAVLAGMCLAGGRWPP